MTNAFIVSVIAHLRQSSLSSDLLTMMVAGLGDRQGRTSQPGGRSTAKKPKATPRIGGSFDLAFRAFGPCLDEFPIRTVEGRHARGGGTMKIVVGVDGSEHSSRAVAWCGKYASRLDAKVIAVHSIELLVYAEAEGYVMPRYSDEEREKLRCVVIDQWCEALVQAKVAVRAVLTEGNPASAIRETADSEDADLVVVGRRGLGGFKELVLGSTSHQLSHHIGRPLVIVP
jgi:nucleotide-binding universal stress UspA family protein